MEVMVKNRYSSCRTGKETHIEKDKGFFPALRFFSLRFSILLIHLSTVFQT
jgi:hypothetical protein